MDRQAENIHGSGLRENWVTLFCEALAQAADGGDYLPHLRRARGRAEAEGRQADADCALALTYAASCQGDPVRAAELLGAAPANGTRVINRTDTEMRRLGSSGWHATGMVGRGQPDNVVAVINYKGGVGKTTLTANIGAELAYRGKTVLLIDLDPQASLTFSLYDPPLWERELADERTILQWFGSVLAPGSAEPLSKFVLTPPAVNQVISGNSDGRLDLVASHLGLIDVDLDFAAELGGSRFQHGSPRYLELHRSLVEALADEAFEEYDLVLIDCAPNFTMVTRAGIVASDYLVVPAKPDYISTLGIDFLRKKLSELVHEYNRVAPPGDLRIDPQILGIVFTMVQYSSAGPINVSRNYLRLGEQIEVPVFQQTVRESKTTFGNAGEEGIPAVLAPTANAMVRYELQQLGVELLAKIRV